MRARAEVSRRGPTIFAAIIVVAFGALAVTTALSERVPLREGSRIEDGPPVEVGEVLESYSITYRVEVGDTPEERNVSTERLEVRRPFESRFRGYTGPPPGTKEVAERGSTAGRLETGSTSLVVPVSPASGDLRFDPVLQAAVDEGLIERRERRSVYGRSCQVYRAGAPVSAGSLVALDGEPDPKDYTDFCVDAAGLLLEEFWVQDGRMLRRKAAVEVFEDPEIPDEAFPEFREGTGPQGGLIGVVEPHDASWDIEPPPGFEHTGTFVVAAPDLTGPEAPAPLDIAPPQMQTSAFTRDGDVILLDQDPSLAVLFGQTGDRHVEPVDIEGFEDAEVVWDFRASEVRLRTPDRSVVRLSGTLPPDELIALARTLHQPFG